MDFQGNKMDPWKQDGFPWKLVRIYIKQDGSMERRWISWK